MDTFIKKMAEPPSKPLRAEDSDDSEDDEESKESVDYNFDEEEESPARIGWKSNVIFIGYNAKEKF